MFGLTGVRLKPTETSPGVGRLVSELRGHQGKVLPHLDPKVGFGDAAVVCVDGVDAGHLLGDQPEDTCTHKPTLRHTKVQLKGGSSGTAGSPTFVSLIEHFIRTTH